MSRWTTPWSAALLQRTGDLPNNCYGKFKVGRTVTNHPLAQILALHVFLSNVVQAVVAADFVNLHDVAVYQRGGRLSFDPKALDIRLIGGELAAQDFEGDLPPERTLFGEIHLGHAAAPQPAQQLIVAHLAAGKVGVERGGRLRHTGARAHLARRAIGVPIVSIVIYERRDNENLRRQLCVLRAHEALVNGTFRKQRTRTL